MNRFETKLAEHHLTFRRSELRTLQINVGRKCNQTCRHCRLRHFFERQVPRHVATQAQADY